MKKIFSILTILLGLFLVSCEPNEEILDEYNKTKDDTGTYEYLFTAEDYAEASGYALEDATNAEDSAAAKAIEVSKSFNITYKAQDYLPPVLNDLFPSLGKDNAIQVTYDEKLGGAYLNKFSTAETYELTTADYDSMGEDEGDPGEYNNFSSSTPPEDYLPDFLAGKYPNAAADDIKLIVYKYYAGYVSTREAYYFFNGTKWAPVSDMYVLNSDDYDGMGAPGKYDNFSSSEPPENYLPAFLADKYPYAQKDDKLIVVYKYYSGSVSTSADEYLYTGTEWISVKTFTQQFINSGEKWVFDPTITFEMSGPDFQLIVDYVQETYGDSYLDSYGNTEYYYGASAYHVNFDIRKDSWNDEVFESWEDAVAEGLALAFLRSKAPDATKTKFGVDMYYKVQFETYDGTSRGEWVMTFRVTEEGNPATFEFVEGPERL